MKDVFFRSHFSSPDTPWVTLSAGTPQCQKTSTNIKRCHKLLNTRPSSQMILNSANSKKCANVEKSGKKPSK